MSSTDTAPGAAAATPSGGLGDGAPVVALTRREARARERRLEATGELVVPATAAAAPAERFVAERAVAVASDAASMQIAVPDVRPAPAAAAVVVAPAATGSPESRRELRARAGRRVPAGPRPLRSAAATPTRPAAATPQRSTTRGARTRRLGMLGGMLFVGATIVSTSVPANAYFVDTPANVAVKLAAAAEAGTTVGGATSPAASQGYIASGTVVDGDVGRDGYSVSVEKPVISSSGTGAFVNDTSASIQWPFATTSPISSGFGSRQVANCSFCSTFHQGLDFTPGAGTPIQVIADGVVSKVEQGGGALGYNVWIDHQIDGQTVTSVYAHMMAGSIKVSQGQTVKVGQQVGNVGSTGNSTGAHLHFEIHLAGVPVDPYPWLIAHAG